MRLEYRILWVDDQIEDLISLGIKDELIAFLEKLAFKPNIDCYETAEAVQEVIQTKNYDLILSDYNIDGDKSGKDLIELIRAGEVFTEILFYSAQSDFDSVARSLYQDRVSYLSLVNDVAYKDFRKKVFRLIELTIKKLQELNSIRGLVMAETSSLDNEIVDILTSFLAEKNENSRILRDSIVKKIIDSVKGNSKRAEKLEGLSDDEILNDRIFDSDKKARSLNKLIEILSINIEETKSFYESYKEDVLDVRNDLAHAKSEIIDGIEFLILSRKDQDKHVKWNQEECIKVRKNLMKYSEILQKIRLKVIDNSISKSN